MAQITVEDLVQVVLRDSKQEEEKVETFDVTGKTNDELKNALKDLCVSARTDLVQTQTIKTSAAFETVARELASQLLASLADQKETVPTGTYSKRKALHSFLSIKAAIAAVQSLDESQLDAQLESTKTKREVVPHSQKALLLASRNDFTAASAQLESAASLYEEVEQSESDVTSTELAGVWSLVGVFRSLDGAYETASRAFEKALSLDSENLDSLLQYAVFTFPVDEVKGKELFDRVEQLNKKSSDYHYHLAQYQCFVRNFASASENVELALQLNDSNASAKFLHKQIVLETKNQEKLRSVLEEILAASDDTDLLALKAQFLLSSRQTDAALSVADQISALESDNPASHIIRGHALCQAAKLDESVASFEEALKLEETSEALLSLAQLKSFKSQSLDEAVSYLALIKKAILLSKSQTERQTLAGIYVVTEADIEAARSLGLSTVVSTGN